MNQNSKKASVTQNYENYWKLTVETTNIHGSQFIDTLRIIIDFIDENHEELKLNKPNPTFNKILQKRVIKFSKRKITVQQEKV